MANIETLKGKIAPSWLKDSGIHLGNQDIRLRDPLSKRVAYSSDTGITVLLAKVSYEVSGLSHHLGLNYEFFIGNENGYLRSGHNGFTSSRRDITDIGIDYDIRENDDKVAIVVYKSTHGVSFGRTLDRLLIFEKDRFVPYDVPLDESCLGDFFEML